MQSIISWLCLLNAGLSKWVVRPKWRWHLRRLRGHGRRFRTRAWRTFDYLQRASGLGKKRPVVVDGVPLACRPVPWGLRNDQRPPALNLLALDAIMNEWNA